MDIIQRLTVSYPNAYPNAEASELIQFFEEGLGVSSGDVTLVGNLPDSQLADPSVAYHVQYHVEYTLPANAAYTYSKDFVFNLQGGEVGPFKKKMKLIRDQWILDCYTKACTKLRDEVNAGTLPPGYSLSVYVGAILSNLIERFPTVDNPN